MILKGSRLASSPLITHCFNQSLLTMGTLNFTVVFEGREEQSDATIVGYDKVLVSVMIL